MNKLYIKISLLLLFLSTTFTVFSQNVGINLSHSSPSANAILDLNTGNSGNLGLIIPNASLTSLNSFNPPIASAATAGDVGLMIYNTNASVGSGVGYYYWTGSAWVSISGGNAITTCATSAANYLPYFTSSNSICSSIIYQKSISQVGVGSISPANMLDDSGSEAIGASYAGTDAAPSNGLIVQGQVGVGTSSPDPSAQLDVTSSSLGILIPRLASNPTTAVTSLLYFNTTSGCYMFYNGTSWQTFICTCNAVPGTPVSISGATSFCVRTTDTYSVASDPNATYYSWNVASAVGTIDSGQNTNTIVIAGATSGGSGTISCYAGNSCGVSSKRTVTVTVNPAPSAFTISQTGTDSPGFACPGTTATFSVASVSGVTYAWSLTSTNVGTISGSSTTNTITVTAGNPGATGSVTCVETNTCGSTTENYSFETDGHGTLTWNGSYSSSASGNVNSWSIPTCVTVITVTASGAQGGQGLSSGGDGATLTKTFTVVAGDVYDIVCGNIPYGTGYGGGGGGGTFMWLDSITLGTSGDYPLIVGGGGGGGGGNYAGLAAGAAASHCGANGTNGGAGSLPNTGTYPESGGPGAGWFTGTGVSSGTHYGGGGNGSSASLYGGSPNSGGNNTGAYGGFGGGGGGGASTNYLPYGGGGGGGGYSGGGGGNGGNTDNTEYGGGGATSGYYNYPDGGYATAAHWIESSTAGTHTGPGSLTVKW